MTNKELITCFFMAAYVHHDYDLLLQIIDETYLDHSPCAAKGNQACIQALKQTAAIFGNMHVKIQDLIEEHETIAVRVSFSGIHIGTFLDIPPAYRQIRFETLEIFRIQNKKIIESWGYWPDADLKRQLSTP